MALTTELLIFEASDALRENIDLPIPAFNIILKAAGVHAPVYYGKQIESPNTRGYAFLHWDSYEAHEAAMAAPSYADLLKGLEPSLSGASPPEMYHVQFSAPTIALEKPVTEVLVFTLKAPENREIVVNILSGISEASGKMFVFGQTREDENKFVVICGWDSIEAHQETAAKPEVATVIQQLRSLTNEEQLYHTSLSQYRL